MFGKKQETENDLELFTIYDSKARVYNNPVQAKNKNVLLRELINRFSDPQGRRENVYYTNAEDFSIFKIGAYDKQTGNLIPVQLEHVANMNDIRALAKTEEEPMVPRIQPD